ncbi:MAG: dienelactone hydrolase family protein [Cyanobacteria bacterium J06636_16]
MTTSSSIKTATVEIQSQDIRIPAYLAHPSSQGRYPMVVVIQEIFGVNAHIRDVTERIAAEGYIAIAPHIYHRQVQGFEVGYSATDLEIGRQYKAGTQADELLSDIRGAIQYVRNQFEDIPIKVGCIGFCFGGHVVYLAATLPDVAATASFYGAGIASSTPGGGPPTLTQTPQISGTVYAFFGEQDPLIPLSDVDAIAAALKNASVDHRIFRYASVGHGFFCDQRDSYNESAAQDAWKQVKDLFTTKLGIV